MSWKWTKKETGCVWWSRFLPFLCSCLSVTVGLPHPHEEYGDFCSAKLITKSLEEKPVLTINSTSLVGQALMWDAGDTKMKGRTPMPNKVPGDGRSKGQHRWWQLQRRRWENSALSTWEGSKCRSHRPLSPHSGFLSLRRGQACSRRRSWRLFPGGVRGCMSAVMTLLLLPRLRPGAPYSIPSLSPTCCNWLWGFAAQKIWKCGEDYNWTVMKGRRSRGGRKMLRSLSTLWRNLCRTFSRKSRKPPF